MSGQILIEHPAISKAYRRILPLLFVLYIVAYLDRANVAFAKLSMSADLRFSDAVFGLGAGLFFLGYLALEIPSAIIAERWSVRLWLSRILVSWGLLTVLVGFVRTPMEFYISRFLLGLAEAGFFPIVIVYLSHWFPARVRARAFSGLILAVPVSFVLGAPIAAACLSVSWLGLPGWRWIFILQGLPAILFGCITPFCITDRPKDAKWLNAEEREWLTSELARENEAKRQDGHMGIRRAFTSWRILVLGTALSLIVLASYGYIFWLPSTIKQHSGRSTVESTLWSTLPFIVAAFAVRPAARSSDRRQERRLHTAVPLFAAGLSFAMSAIPGQPFPLTMFWLCLTGTFLWAWSPPFWVLPTMTLGESAAAASIGFINCIGNVGGFVGPSVVGYLVTSGYSPAVVVLFLSACFLAAGGLILTVKPPRTQSVAAITADRAICDLP
ncbi:MAG: MFS transporter [Bryobacteraceae bacterium]